MRLIAAPGLHDTIHYHFSSFTPGMRRHYRILPEFSPQKTPEPIMEKEVTVRVPARLTTCILDTNDLSIEHPGGGMFGIGVEGFHTTVKMKLKGLSDETEFTAHTNPAVKHIITLLSHIAGVKATIEIKVIEKTRSHVGLASNSMLTLAAAVAFNELAGRPFTYRQLRKILSYNYVEKHTDKTVQFGLNAGTSQALGLYGGMVLLTSRAEIVCQKELPLDEHILVYMPQNDGVRDLISGEGEATRILNEVRRLDRWQSQGRIYRVFLELIPSMKNQDMAAIGDIMMDFMFQGHQFGLLTQIYQQDYNRLFQEFRQRKAHVCGISSGGPTIYATGTMAHLKDIQRWLTNEYGARKEEVSICKPSTGITISMNGRITKISAEGD